SRGSSPTSSRNSVPWSASTNLPSFFSCAPVNEPFSWPNRIDSTRFSGIAPQLTEMNGLPERSEAPWMQRAMTSLPTPDSPRISSALDEADDLAHRRRAGDHVLEAHLAVGFLGEALHLAAQVRELEGVADRDGDALWRGRLHEEVDRAGPHGLDDSVDAAGGGEHDDREVGAALHQAFERLHAREARHDEVEEDDIHAVARVGSFFEGAFTILDDARAEALLLGRGLH